MCSLCPFGHPLFAIAALRASPLSYYCFKLAYQQEDLGRTLLCNLPYYHLFTTPNPDTMCARYASIPLSLAVCVHRNTGDCCRRASYSFCDRILRAITLPFSPSPSPSHSHSHSQSPSLPPSPSPSPSQSPSLSPSPSHHLPSHCPLPEAPPTQPLSLSHLWAIN